MSNGAGREAKNSEKNTDRMQLMTMNSFFETIGQLLFRYRAAIAVPFFVLLVLFGRSRRLDILPIILLPAGIGIRIWAAGYIGENARKNSFCTGARIVNGPYRLLKHPLYLGNLLLVIAITILYNPPHWLFISILAAFMIIYSLIVIGESRYLKTLPSVRGVFTIKSIRHEISTLLIIVFILMLYFLKTYLI